MPPARDKKTGRFKKSGGGLGGAFVTIGVNLSSFSRQLAKARRMFTGGMQRMARAAGVVRKAVGAILGPFKMLLKPLSILGSITGAIGFGASVKAFADFESAMARVGAVSQATGKEFKSLWDQARELGRTTAFSATQAAEAMGNFSVAGFKVAETQAAIEPALNLAAAGMLDMSTASDIVAKTMRGMGLDASETAHAVDVMAKAFTTSNTDLQMLGDAFRYVGPVGKAAGKSFEELTASIQVMSDAGIQGQQAGVAMRNILQRLQTQPAEVERTLKQLGVSIQDQFGRMRSMADIVDDLNASMQNMTEVERNTAVAALAGARAMAPMLTLLDKGGDSLREYQKRLEGAGGTAKKIADQQLDTLSGSFQLLWSAVSDAAITIGETMAPALRLVAGALSDMMPTISEAAKQFGEFAISIGHSIVSKLRTMQQWIKTSIPWLKKLADTAADTVFDPMGMGEVGLKKFQAAGLDVFSYLVEGLSKFIVDLRSTFSIGALQLKAAILHGLANMPGADSIFKDYAHRADTQVSNAKLLASRGLEEVAPGQFREMSKDTFLGTYASTLRNKATSLNDTANDEWKAIRDDRQMMQTTTPEQEAALELFRSARAGLSGAAGSAKTFAEGMAKGYMAAIRGGPGGVDGMAGEKGKAGGGGGSITSLASHIADMQKKAYGDKAQKTAEQTEQHTKETAKAMPTVVERLTEIGEKIAGNVGGAFFAP